MKDYSWKPAWGQIHKESDTHPHCQEEMAVLFETNDSGSTEYEVLNWLHSTIRVFKPSTVLETGAYHGLGTIALAHACRLNGFGKVHSLEVSKSHVDRVRKALELQGLSDWAIVHETDSLSFIEKNETVFDIGFFDSETHLRASECQMLLDKGQLSKIAVFHDTSPYRSKTMANVTPEAVQAEYRQKVLSLAQRSECTGFFDSPLSRGFIALFFNFSKQLAK